MSAEDRNGSGDVTAGSGAADAPAARSITPKSIGVGLALTIALAILVPWNDWALENTLLYNHFMPPAVTLALLAIGLVVNPLLGRFRLCMGELVVVTIMLLALGGTVSSGLNRYLPTVMVNSAELLASKPRLAPLKQELADEEIATHFAASDHDDDGRLTSARWPFGTDSFAAYDRDDDDAVTMTEIRALRDDPEAEAPPLWQWPVASELSIAVPEVGPVRTNDPEYQYVVNGYLGGLGSEVERTRVGHRRVVSWQVSPGGEHASAVALGGRVARDWRDAGREFLDLENPDFGAALEGLQVGQDAFVPGDRMHQVRAEDSWESLARTYFDDAQRARALALFNQRALDDPLQPGEEVAIPDVVRITAVEPLEVPWYAWLGPLLAWSPLLLGAFIASIALAWLVRRQWIHNERLPYPIAAVTMSLIEDPERGRRLAPIYRQRGFWIGASIACFVIVWRGLHAYGVMPVNITTEFNLGGAGQPFNGHPWNLAYKPWAFYNLRIWFSIIALTFFLSLELSFSLWFFFFATNVVVLLLKLSGVPVESQQIGEASAGGFFTMCLLIVYIGRQYYWRALKAACFLGDDADGRRAAPYLWALIIGSLMMMGFMMAHGSPFWAAALNVLLFLGFMLVISRIVAEAGVPFVQIPSSSYPVHTYFTAVGFGLPAAALLPLTLIGITLLADPREGLMPYAANSGYLVDRAKVPPRRGALLMLVAVSLGCVVSFGAMLYFNYTGTGSTDEWAPKLLERDGFQAVADGKQALAGEETAAKQWEDRTDSMTAYGFGAVFVALLGWARLAFASWPLHPLGFLTIATYPTMIVWFSFFLGWMFKLLVMRYGGTKLYTHLKPVAIGLIAGEALAAGGFMVFKMIASVALDQSFPVFKALPG